MLDVWKGFHSHKSGAQHVILRGVHGRIRRGDQVGILGRNGSGKSTLLRLLSGVENPDRGVIRREMNWAISRSSPAPRVLRPLTTPTRSCTSRFWLIFHLPLSRVMAKRKPTMPRNMTSM